MKKFSFAIAITFVCIVFLLGIVTIDSYAVANDNLETFFTGQDSDMLAEPYDLATPNITFLTHDIGEDASSWSKDDYGFGYNENSIIEQIKQKAGDVNVFWAGVHSEKKSGSLEQCQASGHELWND